MIKVCSRVLRSFLILFIAASGTVLSSTAVAAPPVVKTVPWVATNPLIPHDTWSGKTITLKGTADVQGATILWTWDFGDGTPVATGTVSNAYVIQATHAYTGAVGTVFTARLTVQNTLTGETGSKTTFVAIRPQQLQVEVNVAIDEGLWYLHKYQYRYTSGGINYGHWASGGGYVNSGYYGVTATNINAFEVNGHLESGDPDNPYTETVARGLKQLFAWLYASSIPAAQTNPKGTFNPDTNGNGIGVFINQSYQFYQGGMFMDALVATGTPNAITTTGSANIVGRKYLDILQDMADAYFYCQYDGSSAGGWRYNCQEFPDNSACQWAAIGLIAADRQWGIPAPIAVKLSNADWLTYSQASTGPFGYTSPGYYPWGPYALTPSGLVQLAWNGIGRGDPRWDKAETYLRNNFGNGGGATTSIKMYYYGLFSFVKSMLLHDSNSDGVPEPITLLQSSTAGINPIDWYGAQVSAGDPTDGVARTLVYHQNSGGFWYGHNSDGNQYPFETAWAIIMLNRTIFQAGAPVAVASATPNPAVAGQTITLDGSGSFHQDPSKNIVSWQWDFNNDGTFDANGPIVTTSYGALGNYPITLQVGDNNSPPSQAQTIITLLVSTPPLAPTAQAGGPYSFCANRMPWFLDGTKSVNPDEGQSEPGKPANTIIEYAWDLDGDNDFNDAFGAQPNVTAFLTSLGPGAYLIKLRVTDNTSLSFPSSGQPNLTDVATAQVFVRAASDPACGCVSDLRSYPKNSLVQLSWSLYSGADHYNVYRATTNGGPYLKIGVATGTQTVFFDRSVVNLTTYYYVLRPASANSIETCQSNQVSALPRALR